MLTNNSATVGDNSWLCFFLCSKTRHMLTQRRKSLDFWIRQVLRDALSSKSNFRRQYFELSELAMGTFKHMGHYRAVRCIGSDLANFHLWVHSHSLLLPVVMTGRVFFCRRIRLFINSRVFDSLGLALTAADLTGFSARSSFKHVCCEMPLEAHPQKWTATLFSCFFAACSIVSEFRCSCRRRCYQVKRRIKPSA